MHYIKKWLRQIVGHGLGAVLSVLDAVGIHRVSVFPRLPKRIRAYLWLTPLPTTIRVDSGLGRDLVFANARSAEIYKTYYWLGFLCYEPGTARYVVEQASKYDWFCDVGAYLGHYTILFALCNANADIRCFEPVPEVSSALRRNLDENNISHATLFEAAVSSGTGRTTFNLPPESLSRLPNTGSLLKRNYSGNAQESPSNRQIQVSVIAAVEAFSGLAEGRGLIKIDAEGAEAKILSAAVNFFEAARPDIIFEVLYPPESDYGLIETGLRPLGYKFFLLGDSPIELRSLSDIPRSSLPYKKETDHSAWGEVLATCGPEWPPRCID